MKIKYENELIKTWDWVILKHVFISSFFYQYDSNNTKIIQYFIMHGMGLCIKLNFFVSHMFFAWQFSHNTAVNIYINQRKYFIYLTIYTTVFDWVSGVNIIYTEKIK